MGKFSRDKGYRAEILVRDRLRAAGYEADRVPLSGASAAYPGDIRARKDGKEYHVEVKCRAEGFKAIYEAFTSTAVDGVLRLAVGENGTGPLVRITDNPDAALAPAPSGGELFPPFIARAASHGGGRGGLGKRLSRKLLNCQKWLGPCDVLVVKDDRAPVLYIRYFN